MPKTRNPDSLGAASASSARGLGPPRFGDILVAIWGVVPLWLGPPLQPQGLPRALRVVLSTSLQIDWFHGSAGFSA